MKSLVTFAALVTLSAPALAEPYDATQPARPADGYLVSSVSVGGQRALRGGLSLELGHRMSEDSPLFLHVMAAAGTNATFGTGGGSYQQLRAGVEARTCAAREFFCAFAGLDAGYQRDRINSEPWGFGHGEPGDPYIVNAHDLIVVPRLGVEAGRRIKVRSAIEAPLSRRFDATMDSDTSRSGEGLMILLGVGGAW
jgi:hypothetical protein